MKTILKTIFFSALLVFAIGLHAHCQGTNGNIKPDAEIQKLESLMDSAMKKINLEMAKLEPTMTVKDYKEYYIAFDYFRKVLKEIWIEERKKKGGK